MPSVGPSVRSARERLGWTREALAYRSGLSWAAIAQIESGRRQDIRLGSLLALAHALGVSVDYLVGDGTVTAPKLLEHRALVFDSDEAYLAAAVPFLEEGIAHDEYVMVVAEGRRAGLLHGALGGEASRIDFRDCSEWYRSPYQSLDDLRQVVRDQRQRGAHWIRILGEPVWIGRSRAELMEWTRYEAMLNLSLASSPATILCPYDAPSLPADVLTSAGHTHPEITEAGATTTSATYREPEDYLLTPSSLFRKTGGSRARSHHE